MPQSLTPAAELQARNARIRTVRELIDDWADHVADVSRRQITRDHVSKSFLKNFKETNTRYRGLRNNLRDEDLEPIAAAELYRTMLDGLIYADQIDEDNYLDVVDDLLNRLEQIRCILRDALDWHIHNLGDDRTALIAQIREWLPTTSNDEIAELLGVSGRTANRWLTTPGPAEARLTIVAKLISILRLSRSEAGVMAWFKRPRIELDDETPLAALEALGQAETIRDDEQILLLLAKRGRSMQTA